MICDEKIMVCVHYVQNGERLIRRGGELSQLFESPLYVLSVISEQDEHDQAQARSHWQRICEEWGAELIIKPRGHKKVAEAIAEAAKQCGITQLIIGQSAQTRWQEIMHGSIINELLNRLDGVDIHVVAVQRINESLAQTNDLSVPAKHVK
ncbi:hypothetical protein J40TS1_29910 [Paenibacillus montaniterrae]|uniref:UspA domain-containing protein n=1 Tax=Paenibacillus montaniterrae TaxID=429341 RepID=A0A920CZU9_9BACL|nr:universal stress protein [Paenibacillus montaniterrae]GIP17349.1 hypothetical protein J40TS1_29910 [Paenibacillus montaniterrae]